MAQQINGSQVAIGTPTDLPFGTTKNVPGVSSSDNIPDAIDKIVSILDKLAPSKSPDLSTKFLSPVSALQSARHTASASGVISITSSTSGNQLFVGGVWSLASAGSIYSNISLLAKPVFIISDSVSGSSLATFSDGQSGTLTTIIDNDITGTRTLDSGYYTQSQSGSPDVGTWSDNNVLNSNGGLTITFDGDPYLNPPNVGFWTSLKASMSPTQSFVEDGREHYHRMISNYGQSNQVAKGLDGSGSLQAGFSMIYSTGSGTPPNTLYSYNAIVVTQSNPTYNSGVPSLSVGDYVSASYSILNNGNLISRFYNSTRITSFQIVASSSNTAKNDLQGGLPINNGFIPTAYQATYSVNGITSSVVSGMFATNSTFNLTIYGPYGNSVSNTTGTTGIGSWGQPGKFLYIDTIGSEVSINRIWSGTNSYPGFTLSATYSQFFGPTYTAVTQKLNLNNSGNEELQYIGGIFKYPSGNYTNNYPLAGYDYATVSSGSFNGCRWVTFNVGRVEGVQTLNININGANSTLSSASANSTVGRFITNSFYMYVKVVGSIGSSWFDANLDAVSLPTNDGDGCLVKLGSTPTYRRVSFGTSSKTGAVYVRIGILSSPGYQFTGLSLT